MRQFIKPYTTVSDVVYGFYLIDFSEDNLRECIVYQAGLSAEFSEEITEETKEKDKNK